MARWNLFCDIRNLARYKIHNTKEKCTHTHLYTYTSLYTHKYTHIRTYIYIYTYIPIKREREREKEWCKKLIMQSETSYNCQTDLRERQHMLLLTK